MVVQNKLTRVDLPSAKRRPTGRRHRTRRPNKKPLLRAVHNQKGFEPKRNEPNNADVPIDEFIPDYRGHR